MMFDVIAFDADDTLWHNEAFYAQGKAWLGELLAGYVDPSFVVDDLEETEVRNLQYFGYGIKSFTLSMIETAVRTTGSRVQPYEILQIVEQCKTMVSMDPEHFEGIAGTLENLSNEYNLMLITKGDLFEQERKIERSPLRQYFKYVEIVGSKEPDTYRTIMDKFGVEPKRFLMVGNSLRSDVLPVLAAGGHAVYIPYEHTWAHENDVPQEESGSGYHEVEHIKQIPELLRKLAAEP